MIKYPVITIDGPTASGKGTVTKLVANALGWHVLDSGALYRLTALDAQNQGVDIKDIDAVANIAKNLDIKFDNDLVLLRGIDVSQEIRYEKIGEMASIVASYTPVREALLHRQRQFRQSPGLVGDGRDMGTVIFPDAQLKIFLTASVDSRAQRRYKQLIDKGISANLSDLTEDLLMRDKRDIERANAPLVAASDAVTIDSSDLSIDETVNKVLNLWSNSVQNNT